MSIVRYDFRHIFCHVPKTGGTSMHSFHWIASNGHCHMSELFRRCRHQGENPEEFFSWGFVRNPYDRFVSAFFAYKQHPQPHGRPKGIQTLKAFAAHLARNPQLINSYPHLRSQTTWLDAPVSFVGRFENMEEDWEKVCRRVTGRSWALPNINSTHRKPIDEALDEEDRQNLFKVYREDFDAFLYDQ